MNKQIHLIEDEGIEAVLQGRKFKKILKCMYEEIRSTYGLKQVEAETLLYLAVHPGISACDISSALLLQKGHVSLAVDGLRQKGYISCIRDHNDRRYTRFQVTDSGMKICEALQIQKAELEQILFQGFTEEEIKLVSALVGRIMNNIDNYKLSETELPNENRS